MKSRPAAATFFVVFCLLLCGLILRRQIAAHPLPLAAGRGADGSQEETDFQNWHPAVPDDARQVFSAMKSELTGLNTDDAPRALSSQSRFSRQRNSDPGEFLRRMHDYHPELFQYRQVVPGPVWVDKLGQNARVVLFILSKGGGRTRDDFWLLREDGQFKVLHIRTQVLPN